MSQSTILIDGFVQGLWKIEHQKNSVTLIIELFKHLSQLKTRLQWKVQSYLNLLLKIPMFVIFGLDLSCPSGDDIFKAKEKDNEISVIHQEEP